MDKDDLQRLRSIVQASADRRGRESEAQEQAQRTEAEFRKEFGHRRQEVMAMLGDLGRTLKAERQLTTETLHGLPRQARQAVEPSLSFVVWVNPQIPQTAVERPALDIFILPQHQQVGFQEFLGGKPDGAPEPPEFVTLDEFDAEAVKERTFLLLKKVL